MKLRKRIGWAVLALVTGIQFIRPARNNSEQVAAAGFVRSFGVPDSVNRILQSSCYDCHSNRTKYPWYSQIQPFGWVLSRHIRRGKSELNFSEFAGYSLRRQVSKFKAIASQVEDNEMPLKSYKLLHKQAKLSDGEKNLLVTWMRNKADSVSRVDQ
jgi:hypothetical protein